MEPSDRSARPIGAIDVNRLPAPVQLLIAAGRKSLDSQAYPCSRPTPDDRALLPDYALRHGMAAWLPAAATIAPDRSAEVASAESSALRRQAARALAVVRDLLEAVGRLEAAGISVVALKGPVFSAWMYGDPAARSFNDLDLLVPESARAHALELLNSIGYVPAIPKGAADVVYGSIGAWPLKRHDGAAVDLHWRLAGRRFAHVLGAEEVIRNAVRVRTCGREIAAPGPTHAAALALTHAAKHLWYSLELSLTIAHLMHRDDVSWDDVRSLALKADAILAAAAGLQIASTLFAAPIPPPFVDDVRRPEVNELCTCAAATLALPPYVFPDRRIDRRVHRLCFERVANRIEYDIRRVIEPTHADWAWLPLPAPLAALYVPVRLVRLAGAGLGIWKGAGAA